MKIVILKHLDSNVLNNFEESGQNNEARVGIL